MTRRIRAMWGTATTFCAVMCGSVGVARAQTVALECTYPELGESVEIVVDYERSVVSIYPASQKDRDVLVFQTKIQGFPSAIIEGDHIVHPAAITDDFIKWSGVPTNGLANALAPVDTRITQATIDRKTGTFSVESWPTANGQTELTGTCTKRGDTNKF